MSDTGTPAAAPAAPSVAETIQAQQAGIAPPAVGDTIDRARYDSEIASHVRERNFYKPAQRLLADLDEPSQQALLALADAARKGDKDAILQWAEETMESVGGKSAADVIAERQAARRTVETAPTGQPVQPALTQSQIDALVDARLQLKQNEAEVRGIMNEAGYQLGTPAGDVIIRYCVQHDVGPAEGIAWFKAGLGAPPPVPGAAAAAAVQAGGLPGTAPTGAAPGTSPTDGMTWKEKAVARLREVGGT